MVSFSDHEYPLRSARLPDQAVAVPPATAAGAGLASTDKQAGGALDTDGWGLLPQLSLVAAVALVIESVASTLARQESAWAELCFWVGLLVLFVPIAARQCVAAVSRRERLGLLCVLGVGFYLVKVLQYPLTFTYSDELAHWRTTQDILQSGHAFSHNPLLLVSPFFPGMELVAAALTSLSDLAIFHAGVLILGVGRLVFMLASFLFYEQISGSSRIGGIAALLYATNPNFMFFDAQYSYESLALPFASLVFFLAARRILAPRAEAAGLTLLAIIGIGAVVVTHHLTSYALTAFLLVWAGTSAIIAALRRDRELLFRGPRDLALVSVLAVAGWFLTTANLVGSYLAPHITRATSELAGIITGARSARQLFKPPGADLVPLWEQVTGFASVALVLIGLPFGLLAIRRRYGGNAVALTLALATLLYPVSLAFRLTQFGAEGANRTSEFLFVPIAFALAVAVEEFGLTERLRWLSTRTAVLTGLVSVLLVGGVMVGWARWVRLPGPFLVSGDPRSWQPQSVDAAEWARDILGPDNRLATDRNNRLYMGAVGDQHTVTGYGDLIPVYRLFFSPDVGPTERSLLQRGQVEYLVVDLRLTTGLPSTGHYFERGEPKDSTGAPLPLDPAFLTKFDGVPGVNRIFHSGDIITYDVGAISSAR